MWGFWGRVLRDDTEFQAVVTRRDACLVPSKRDMQRAGSNGRKEASITALSPSGRPWTKQEGRGKSRACVARPMLITQCGPFRLAGRKPLSRSPISRKPKACVAGVRVGVGAQDTGGSH